MMHTKIIPFLKAVFVYVRLKIFLIPKRKFLSHGKGLHIGKGGLFWAPDHIRIGYCVYFGKYVTVEANITIGNYVLIANRVGFVGRHDHDYSAIGYPVRLSPWVGDLEVGHPHRKEQVIVEDDVWIGYNSTVLTGVTIGKGSIVAAGSLVTKDIAPYSIVGGVPARELGRRFSDEEILEHEAKIKTGEFYYSPFGLSNSVIKPGKNV
jgi:acetyltransferase-like isoleucine patch superfamily enzyme